MTTKLLRSVLMLLIGLCFTWATALAQNGTIKGRVTDQQTGKAIIGVNVFISSISQGAATDVDGNFIIEDVPYGTYTLRVSYIGYKTKNVTVTVNEVNESVSLTLVQNIGQLKELVVTAFGVEREQRSLGYSAQSVSADALSENPEVNFVNSLQGKIAGVNIVQGSGVVGGSSSILLRGVSSLTGDSQPLFIVDGVYVDNSNFGMAGEFGGVDFGNAAMDINGSNIKSITVLKGPNAAALYGSRASNGVILIETKDGSAAVRGIGVDVHSTVEFSKVSILPDLQNEYGQGSNGEFVYVDGAGGGVNDGTDESWGPRLDGTPRVQWWTKGEAKPWIAHPNNIRNFLETGSTINNSIALSGNYDKTNFRFAATNVLQQGTIPNSELESYNFLLSAGVDLTEQFRATGHISYTQLIVNNRPGMGYSSENPMQSITQWFGRQVSMKRLKDYTFADGSPRNWNYNYHDNPYWQQYMNTNSQHRNRVIGNLELFYELTDWFSLQGKIGTDWYRDGRESVRAVGTLNDPLGDYGKNNYYVNQWRGNVTAKINRSISDNFSLKGIAGFEYFNRTVNTTFGRAPELIVPGVYTLDNSAIRPNVSSRLSEQATNGLYAALTLGYNDLLYLDLTGRKDWSSTLPVGKNSYFYPSASLSLIFTEIIDMPNWVSFGKLRASWTRVGSDTNPYNLVPYFKNRGVFGSVPRYTVDNTLANAELEPEFTTSIELGAELRFFNDRLGLDLTYYDSKRTNQITPVQISPASGYTSRYVNVGEIANNGIEATLNLTPVLSNDFQWNITLNWAKNNNEVVSLANNLDTYIHYSSWDVTIESRPGEDFGSLYGYGFLRDEQGNIVVDSDGVPMLDSSKKINFGSYQPDWTGSIFNSIDFKNFNLSFLVDFRHGGSLTSTTYMFGRYTGVLIESLKGREDGFVFDGGIWADGAVKEDGSPNDIKVSAQDFGHGTFFGNAESHIFDASYVKLREVRIGYSVPLKALSKLPFSKLNISLVGRNLWIIHKNAPHIDPETAFNTNSVMGTESNQIPSVRSFGVSIHIGF